MQRMMMDSAKIASEAMALQRDSIAELRERYNIPKANIYGHDFLVAEGWRCSIKLPI